MSESAYNSPLALRKLALEGSSSCFSSPARSIASSTGDTGAGTDSEYDDNFTDEVLVTEVPGAPDQTIVAGWLKFRDNKRWKHRWGVVTKLSPAADSETLKQSICRGKMKFFLALLVLTVPIFVNSDITGIIVTTKNGDIEGIFTNSTLDKEFYVFTSIPFAEPPVGKYRFMEAAPKQNWNGTLKATKDIPDCVQPSAFLISGDEDCLYLNIYTPQLANSDKSNLKPVMFFIHGGFFLLGSLQTYDQPDLLIEHDVVVVTANYRLNIFGFLSSGTEHIPGNAGLKDLILALRWVKENIEAFGGDPNSVTIFGESAGAVSVHYLMLSPLAKGLFRNAISESGSSLASWSLKINPKENFLNIADELNMSEDNFTAIVEKLQFMNYKDLFDIFLKTITNAGKLDEFPYAPCIEPISKNAVITESPASILQRGDFNPVPYITGVNSCEGLLFAPLYFLPQVREDYTENITKFLPSTWITTLNNDMIFLELEEKLREHYNPEDELISTQSIIDNISDIGFYFPLISTLLLQEKISPVFTYVFSYSHNLTNLFDLCGVFHTGELPFIWHPTIALLDDKTTAVSKKLTKLLTNFAKFGNPTPEEDPELDNIIWNRVNSSSIENIMYLNITNSLDLKKGLYTERTKFWVNLWKEYCFPNSVCRYFNS